MPGFESTVAVWFPGRTAWAKDDAGGGCDDQRGPRRERLNVLRYILCPGMAATTAVTQSALLIPMIFTHIRQAMRKRKCHSTIGYDLTGSIITSPQRIKAPTSSRELPYSACAACSGASSTVYQPDVNVVVHE